MERPQITRAIALGCVAAVFILSSCANPFAPALRGEAESLWTNAGTVGDMLENFVTSYELRDSLRYAELLDESFQFRYFDVDLDRYDGWFRETDLNSTSRLFHAYQNISLIWSGLSPAVSEISTADSLVDFRIHYQLILEDFAPLLGFARFTVIKPEGERFRIILWQDEF